MWDLTSPTKDRTCVPCIAGQILNHRPPGKSPSQSYLQTPMPSSKRATSRLVTCCCPGPVVIPEPGRLSQGTMVICLYGPEHMLRRNVSVFLLLDSLMSNSSQDLHVKKCSWGVGVDSAQLRVLVLSPHWGPCAPWALLVGFRADSSICLPACMSSASDIHILCSLSNFFFY